MALSDLVKDKSISPFTDEDRIAQTEKLVERTFSAPASTIGSVQMKDGQPALVFTHNGAEHALTWSRDARGRVIWTLNGKNQVYGLGGDNAAARLLAAVE